MLQKYLLQNPCCPSETQHGIVILTRSTHDLAIPMSANAKKTYRVHVEGMNPTERKIFGGMIHLAERHGTVFMLESALEKSNIFIFDGTNPQALEFERSHSHLAPNTIWIDPPAHLHAIRRIRRPFRWSMVLEMMEQMVSQPLSPVSSDPGRPLVEISFDQMCAVAQEVLKRHIGIAAGFVLDDVRAERALIAATNETLIADVFVDALKRQLPSNVDANRVVQEVSAALKAQG